MTTQPPTPKAVEAALSFCADRFDDNYDWELCWNSFTAARILAVEVERLRKMCVHCPDCGAIARAALAKKEGER